MYKLKAIIADFDNTLFDWYQMWYKSSNAMINKIVEISGIENDALLEEIRKVHQQYGTSEYSFLIQEIKALSKGLNRKELLSKYNEAIKVYKFERKKNLKLYPKVRRTLNKLKAAEIQIIVYTESKDYYSKKRLKALKLDGIVDHIFFPKEKIKPGIKVHQFRSRSQEEYTLQYTKSHLLPKDDKKPNPKTLTDILKKLSLKKEEVLFVGDSLMKDISMANDAGVLSVWAKYGAHPNPEEYQLLQKVSHWTDQDIEREKEIRKRTDIRPDYVLENHFGEIFNYIKINKHGKQTLS